MHRSNQINNDLAFGVCTCLLFCCIPVNTDYIELKPPLPEISLNVQHAQNWTPRGNGILAAKQDLTNYTLFEPSSTSDQGRGTFREALETPGNRIIRSRLPAWSTVLVHSQIEVAPGAIWFEGNCVVFSCTAGGIKPTQNNLINFGNTSSMVFVRDVVFKPQYSGKTNHDTIDIGDYSKKEAQHFYFLNCEFYHGTDEIQSAVQTNYVTLDRCIFGYATAGHLNGNAKRYGQLYVDCEKVSWIECLSLCNFWRNPKMHAESTLNNLATGELINCVSYNHSSGHLTMSADDNGLVEMNIAGCVFLHGPNGPRYGNDKPKTRYIHFQHPKSSGSYKVHLQDNIAFEYYGGPSIPFRHSLTKGVDPARISILDTPVQGGFTVKPLPSSRTLDVVLRNAGAGPELDQRPFAKHAYSQVLNNRGRLIHVPTELNFVPRGKGQYYRPQGKNAGPFLQIAVGDSSSQIILSLTNKDGIGSPISYPVGTKFYLYGTNGLDGEYVAVGFHEQWSVMQPVKSQMNGDSQVVNGSFYLSVLVPNVDPQDR